MTFDLCTFRQGRVPLNLGSRASQNGPKLAIHNCRFLNREIDGVEMKKTIALVLLAATVGVASAADVKMRLLKKIELDGDGKNVTSSTSANYIGPNIYSLTTSGGNVYVGGYNNSSAATTCAVLAISNFIGADTVARVAGTLTTTNVPTGGAGYYGLAVSGNNLVSNVNRNASTLVGDEIRATDLTSGALVWDGRTANSLANARVAASIDIDPLTGNVGYTGNLQGFAARAGLLNSSTGVTSTTWNYTSAAPPGMTSFLRGMAFDSAGNAWLRGNNQVAKVNRATGTVTTLGTGGLLLGAAASNIGQHIEAMSDFFGNEVFIANNRASGATGQAFTGIQKMFKADGTLLSVDWVDNVDAPLALPNGNGIYTYSYDASSKVLYMLDSHNSAVYAFQAVPEPTTMIGLVAGAAALLRKRRNR